MAPLEVGPPASYLRCCMPDCAAAGPSFELAGGRPLLVTVRVVDHLVDGDGDREDEAVVLAR